jgi:hypothetical protein
MRTDVGTDPCAPPRPRGRQSGFGSCPAGGVRGFDLRSRREIAHNSTPGTDLATIADANRTQRQGRSTKIYIVADYRETRASAYILVRSSAAHATMTPEGAVRSDAPEYLCADRMDHQQAWTDLADWSDIRAGHDQIHVPEEAGEKAMVPPIEVVGYSMEPDALIGWVER